MTNGQCQKTIMLYKNMPKICNRPIFQCYRFIAYLKHAVVTLWGGFLLQLHPLILIKPLQPLHSALNIQTYEAPLHDFRTSFPIPQLSTKQISCIVRFYGLFCCFNFYIINGRCDPLPQFQYSLKNSNTFIDRGKKVPFNFRGHSTN